jgi:hypothetical protein
MTFTLAQKSVAYPCLAAQTCRPMLPVGSQVDPHLQAVSLAPQETLFQRSPLAESQ